ncbi:MAG: DUF1015 domain-containing protein [Bacillota bacterium]
MVTILPIKGVRYAQAAGCKYSDLVTPPYDVISPEQQELFYNKSPYNIIRLEYGKSLPGDDAQNNRYTRAARTFKEWLDKKILFQEKEEAVYLYEQHFIYNNEYYMRQALLCGVKLTPFSTGEVIPHEETLDKPKADRLKLLQHCEANFSPVFGLFKDPNRIVESQSSYIKKKMDPALNFKDEEGQLHKLWVVYDQKFIELVQKFFRRKRIYIADGHHRYETSLQFYEEKRKTLGLADNYAHTLMALVNIYDEGLLTLPTHRLITRSKITTAVLLKELAKVFSVTEMLEPRNRDQLERLLERFLTGSQERKFSFGLYTGDRRFFILTEENRPFPWLDTVVLQEVVFTGIFGLGSADIRNKSNLRYTRDEWEAKETVDRGDALFAFFVNKPSLEEIVNLSEKGLRLPQKSTYFYPKFITGLVINKLEG